MRLRHRCPYCGAPFVRDFVDGPASITVETLEGVGEEYLSRAVKCGVCRRGWRDVYRLSHIEEVTA